eukprot:2854462-Amphidinium_carterae.1
MFGYATCQEQPTCQEHLLLGTAQLRFELSGALPGKPFASHCSPSSGFTVALHFATLSEPYAQNSLQLHKVFAATCHFCELWAKHFAWFRLLPDLFTTMP